MTTTTPSDETLTEIGARVGKHLLATRRRLVTAESCTGGWIGKVMTDVSGSSTWFSGGAVVYSNELKQALLGIDAAMLAKEGAVSESVVRAMAEAALRKLAGEVAVAVSGIAGPDGGSPSKPVGTVWFAWSLMVAGRTETLVERQVFSGDREAVRRKTVERAIARILEL